jgi:hypothetical protein
MKIDVGGFELKVLLGAKRMLHSAPPPFIQIELIEEFQKRNGETIESAFTLLSDNGYAPFTLSYTPRGPRLLRSPANQ